MQKRLIAFGCSMTYGHGLPDCFVPPCHDGPTPSQFAWPALVANRLDLSIDNQARCGASNLEILNKILEYDYQKDDTVMVMWSFTDRDLIFGRKNIFGQQTNIPVGTWNRTDLSNHWSKAHSEDDVGTRSWFYIHHANLFLKSKNLKCFNFYASQNHLKRFKPKFIDTQVHKVESWKDLGLDKSHPGVKSHQAMAEKIYKIVSKIS
jgi:hypothetical protein